MPTYWSFWTAGQISFGAGAVRELERIAQRRRLRRVFVVTDRNLATAGLDERVRQPLAAAGAVVETFPGGEPEPSIAAAERSIEAARTFQPDAVLGLGGGSNMDLAKITALILTHGGQPSDYFGCERVPGPLLPLICVPTTAGTGSEVSHVAVLTDTVAKIKVTTGSNWLRPAVAIVDPELTYGCPRQVTADSGIDALTHAIEACTATDFDQMQVPPGTICGYEGRYPLGETLAREAIERAGRWLRTAVAEPNHAQARAEMAYASLLAGMAFSNCGVALVHALEYPLGGELHCSHGGGNGLLLPYVMRFNLPARQAAFAKIAAWLGEDVRGLDEAAAAERAIQSVEQLRADIGIPLKIRELGGRADQLARFAEKAMTIQRLFWVNPRTYTVEDLIGIYRAAL